MKEIIKKRSLRVQGMSCEGCARRIYSTLAALEGIKKVKAVNPGTVYIEYDLMKINLKIIEEKIREMNYTLSNGFFSALKRGWLHFIEENEYDSMHAVPVSCCEPKLK